MPLASFAALLDRLTGVTQQGTGYVAHCPAHTDTHPSLVVTYNEVGRKAVMYDRGGCTTTDVLTALGLTDYDLFELDKGDTTLVAETAAVSGGPTTAHTAALAGYATRAHALVTDEVREYVARRFGLDSTAVDALGIGYDDGTVTAGVINLSQRAYHNGPRVTVPFKSVTGAVHYVQARALDKGTEPRWSGPSNPPNATLGKYGVFTHPAAKGVILTEGPGDALAGYACGYTTIGIRGAGLAKSRGLIEELSPILTGTVIVAGDNDRAGDTFAITLTNTLRGAGIHATRAPIPAAYNDFADWVAAVGVDAVSAALTDTPAPTVKEATPLSIDAVHEAAAASLTDDYRARLVLDLAYARGYGIRYSVGGGWHVYNPVTGVWTPGGDDYVLRAVITELAADASRELITRLREIRDDADAFADVSESGKELSKAAHKTYAAHVAGAAASAYLDAPSLDRLVKAMRSIDGVLIDAEQFDATPSKLVVSNGVINLATGGLEPFDRDLFATKRVSVKYDPQARCPRWERFVDEVFESLPATGEGPHAGMPAYLRRLLGYGLHGSGDAQVMAAMVGSGANGKSVLIEVLSSLMGEVTTVSPFEVFERKHGSGNAGPSPELLAMRGARYVVASEGSQGAAMDDALIKRVSGGDKITARALHRAPVTFEARALVLLASNYRPRFVGQDYGIWRRVKLIPFAETFAGERRDPHLVDKLLRRGNWEARIRPGEDYGDGPAGILAWLVAGALEYAQVGLSDPAVVTEATETHREASDPLNEFLVSGVVEDPAATMDASEVFAAYREWALSEGVPEREWPRRANLMQALQQHGYTLERHGRSLRVSGIRAPHKAEIYAA